MTNKFYGIGVGVGDPKEITIKAINTLKKLDVVILPEAKKDDGSVAYEGKCKKRKCKNSSKIIR